MLDSSGRLFGGFIQYWKKKGKLKPANIEKRNDFLFF